MLSLSEQRLEVRRRPGRLATRTRVGLFGLIGWIRRGNGGACGGLAFLHFSSRVRELVFMKLYSRLPYSWPSVQFAMGAEERRTPPSRV